jgi:hypothetical protein
MDFPELQVPVSAPEQVPFSEWNSSSASNSNESNPVPLDQPEEEVAVAKPSKTSPKATVPASSTTRKRGRPSHVCLPKESINVLKEWLYSHAKYPYPSQADKEAMAQETSLSIKQINNWFINARRRYLTNDKKTEKKRRGGWDEAEEWVE